MAELRCEILSRSKQLDVLKAELEKNKISFQAFLEKMNNENASIQEGEGSLEVEIQKIKEYKDKKIEMEQNHQSILNRKEQIELAIHHLDHFQKKWQIQLDSFSLIEEEVLQENLLFSFYLSFCLALPYAEQKMKAEEAFYTLGNCGFTLKIEDPLEHVFQMLESSFSIEFSDFSSPRLLILDSLKARKTTRTPLFLDPCYLVFNYFMTSQKSSNIVAISQNSPNLEKVIQDSVFEGKILLVYDVDSLRPLFHSLFNLRSFAAQDGISREIRIGSKMIAWNSQFSMILFTTLSESMIPQHLKVKVNLIKSSTEEVSSEIIESLFLEFFDPMLFQQFLEHKKYLFEFKSLQEKF